MDLRERIALVIFEWHVAGDWQLRPPGFPRRPDFLACADRVLEQLTDLPPRGSSVTATEDAPPGPSGPG